MVILIVHSKFVILIILSLQLEYYELYCLDLGDYFLFARVEILNLPNKFLFVNNSFYHNNWRCLPTQLLSYHTYIYLCIHIYVYIYICMIDRYKMVISYLYMYIYIYSTNHSNTWCPLDA